MSHPFEASTTTPILFCHCHLRWDWVYQRPQHVLTRLARHWPVVIEEEVVIDDDRPAGVDRLDAAPGVTVLRPHRPVAEERDLTSMVEAQFAAIRAGRPLIRWFYSPMFALKGDRLGPGQTVVYDCMDDLASFAAAPAGLREAEANVLERADVVFTGGRSLYEARRGRNPNVHCVPSAVDADHFARALRADLAIPDDLAALPRPILGYYGVVDERLDYELIARLAESTTGTVALVGPMAKVNPAALPRHDRLHYLGARTYDQLPAYLKGFDVCIMPWALNEATRSISPTKTLEFMAAGKPIVSTAVRDVVRDHGDLVRVAGDLASFLDLTREALLHHDEVRASAERHRAARNSWQAAAELMARRVEEALTAPRRSAAPIPPAAAAVLSGPADLILEGAPA